MRVSRTTKTLVQISLILLILFLLGKTTDVLRPLYDTILFLLAPLILSIYIFYALRPIRDKLIQWTHRKTLATSLTFILFLLILTVIIYVITNLVFEQLRLFLMTVDFEALRELGETNFVHKVDFPIPIERITHQLEQWFRSLSSKVPEAISSLISNVGALGTVTLLIFLAIFYLLKDEDLILDRLNQIKFGKYHETALNIGIKVHEALETYISGQITVAFILGFLMFLGYKIIGLPYAFSLGAITTVLSFIPFVGAIISGVPAVFVALTVSPQMIVYALLVTIIVQQVESNIITPNIMGKKLDIHPFIVIVMVLVMMRLFGVIGALIATPVYMIIRIIVSEVIKMKHQEKNPLDDGSPKYL